MYKRRAPHRAIHETMIKSLKRAWPLGWKIGLVVVAGLVFVQAAYPHDRTLPFARIDTTGVGFAPQSNVQAIIDHDFLTANVTFKTDATSKTVALKTLGASSKSERSIEKLTTYPWWQRLLPGSIFWLHPTVSTYEVVFDDTELQKSAASIASALQTEPVDAGLSIDNNALVFTSAKPGLIVGSADIVAKLRAQRFALHETTVRPAVTKTQPTYTDDDFAAVRAQAEKAIAEPIVFTTQQEQSFTADKATIASWLSVKKADDRTISLSLNVDAVTPFLADINKKIGIAPKPTKVQLRDGVETGRENGVAGTGLNNDEVLQKITGVIDGSSNRSISLTMKPLTPPVAYTRTYSSSQAGLQAYVDYITTAKDVHIALQQLDGAGWSARGRAADSVVSASTYKLYIAMMLFSKMDAGQITWNDQIQGTTVKTCFDQMIVQSLNNCSEDWINHFGRSKLNAFLYSKGISSATTFTAADAAHTSANDLLKTLTGLQNGSLYSGQNRDTLLGDMGRQVYRNGVPAGTSGSVQDKVGFLWDYNHDAAIVHTSKGSYALAIMTKGESFGEIAAITKQLETIMYP